MASLDGISFDIETRPISRTILSSVGGFSQSARQNIRSLQDLLATIQRFNLQVFDSRSLQHKDYVGEGVSYRVSSCWHEANDRVYARKDVKLPPKTADAGAFDRQVACVLRDVEVMYGLAQRPNILDIFGYGWDIESGNVIPFLLTEFAEAGTMRQFLRRNEISLHEKLLFCKDVAQGLHAIHVAGIAHGDLKLDNILMKPYTNLGTSHNSEHEVLRTSLMQACISDFGHSLHLYDDEEDNTVKQRYGGTLAYNAPELLDKTHSRTDINFRKCDIWSLGLTCWEIILGGQAYYHTANVERIILSSPKGPASLPTPPASNTGSQSSSASLLEELINVTPHLAMVASGDVSERAGVFISQAAVFRLCRVFRWCLCVDPAQRIADIPLLPIFHGIPTLQRRLR
ncbi:kinase-like protein [Aaosphaeria arxii CBS 175.79]|uniref:Autophagy-related protein 1 n=1 Tax=Aaosphaeria arxii CBS 175.79 TaxID=1450172 RepID=A0A6A5XIR9_9PLEO|nr:kinase-like protein [Aaosphaeria arxii CBS 175.79]KAF2012843.1 kinase-like protein [Aaosphaeria arxii CBS 175.79]